VIPPGGENAARAMNSDRDTGIEKNLDAALIQSGVPKTVKYGVKNGVVSLTGEANSPSARRPKSLLLQFLM
jgi:hypothetical protein